MKRIALVLSAASFFGLVACGSRITVASAQVAPTGPMSETEALSSSAGGMASEGASQDGWTIVNKEALVAAYENREQVQYNHCEYRAAHEMFVATANGQLSIDESKTSVSAGTQDLVDGQWVESGADSNGAFRNLAQFGPSFAEEIIEEAGHELEAIPTSMVPEIEVSYAKSNQGEYRYRVSGMYAKTYMSYDFEMIIEYVFDRYFYVTRAFSQQNGTRFDVTFNWSILK